MKVLFTCGGTAGHINPAVALAGMFRQRQNAEVLFVGADGGMETTLVPREGYPVKTVTITSFYRSLSGAAIKHNLTTPSPRPPSPPMRPGPFWTNSGPIWW